MRHFLLSIVLLLTGFGSAHATRTSIDSLRSALDKTNAPDEQIRIYRNMADIAGENPESAGYLLRLIEKAREIRKTYPMMEAMTDLTVNYITRDKLDSARYALSLADKYVPEDQRDQWCSYLRMRIFAAEMLSDESEKAVDEKIAEIKARNIAQESLYRQIEAEFNLSSALEKIDNNENVLLPHLLNALEISKKLPFREGAPYQLLIMRKLSRTYNAMQQTQQATDIVKGAIEIKKKHYELYDRNTRPFYSMDDFYVSQYSALLINLVNMPEEEVRYYLGKLVELSDQSQKPGHKYSRFQAQYNYSVALKKDPHLALTYNDSLIRYARQIAPYNLPILYKLNSILYEMIGQDQEALTNLRESSRLQDSVRQSEAQERFDKLRVEYDVNRLNYENSQLEIRNRHIMLVALLIILAIVGGVCIQLYHHLKRERRRKEHMQQLKLRAEESEKLKTMFINSICHEIRTPLNGIVGFAALLLDKTIDEQERETFPEEIQRNTDMLVQLIDGMLEVANLDVSDEKLPNKPVDVAGLCKSVFDNIASTQENSAIERILHLPEKPLVVETHQRYLALVIENLLTNAYKFTEKGSITLHCEERTTDVVITITDTGCGIPHEKHQVVFDRFIKLDTHTQGSGLGLYLCKQIIHRLSGSIGIDPDYTQGTRMIVLLPRR